ncbi:lysylphosphatidylglycerol synthase transmembrane domain-containing protein [Natronosalvus vescus]|uniref:lysylphosphatidylglycerol synthase transmembrane domain-containing protein n=1 Tax=Natronosalvus vescus TaxID=2953881 RepID=UPI002090A75F|nr:lysylphosphatidylglycerol synthase transmembrane domain-containing protein [Natronosalvus vescus]
MHYRRAIAGLSIALVLVGLLVYGVGWEDVLEALRAASPAYVGAAFLSGALVLALRGAVVDRLLRPVAGSATGIAFVAAFLSGYFARSALPWGRSTGSPVMAFLLAKNSDSRFEDNLAVVALAELFVFVGSLLVALVGAVAVFGHAEYDLCWTIGDGLSPAAISDTTTGIVLVLGTVLFAGVVLIYARSGSDLETVAYAFTRRVDDVVQPVPRVSRADPVSYRLDGFIRTLETVSAARRTLVIALTIGFVSWLVNVLPLYFALLALGVEGSLPLAMLCAPLAAFGGVIPLPGGTGGIEAALVVLLVAIGGLPADLATAVTLLYRLTTYWLHLTLGGSGALFLSVRGDRTLTV